MSIKYLNMNQLATGSIDYSNGLLKLDHYCKYSRVFNETSTPSVHRRGLSSTFIRVYSDAVKTIMRQVKPRKIASHSREGVSFVIHAINIDANPYANYPPASLTSVTVLSGLTR